MDTPFHGTGVALVTPFKADKSIDFKAFEKVIEHVIAGGVDFLVPLGSTGESATLNDDEERKILDFVIRVNNGRKPILAGNFGGNHTRELAKKIEQYDFKGIDGIMSSSPAYIKPNQEGIYSHYMEITKNCPLPMLIYNVPGRTRSNIEWETTVRLARDNKTIIGIKEASGDLIQMTRIIKNKPDDFMVTSGDDEIALPMIAAGGHGGISVIANAFPGIFSKMIQAALRLDFVEARRLNFLIYDLHKWLYIEGNPVGIKSALEILGLCENHVRLPLHTMAKNNYERLAREIEKMKALA